MFSDLNRTDQPCTVNPLYKKCLEVVIENIPAKAVERTSLKLYFERIFHVASTGERAKVPTYSYKRAWKGYALAAYSTACQSLKASQAKHVWTSEF